MTQLTRNRTLACLAAALLLAAAPAMSAERTIERSYPLGERGIFRMSAPAAWKEQVAQPPEAAPPTIQFTSTEGKSFQVLVTPLWRTRPEVPIPTREKLRERVEQGSEEFKDPADGKKLKVVEIKGKTGAGFYFTATDKAPAPGEFKYLTQGMLLVSELLVAFTILTNDGQDPIVRDALAMVRSAAHAPK